MVESRAYELDVRMQGDRELVLTRRLDAPRALVFEAMSRPEHISKWWGPRGSTMTVSEMDFRVGGRWRFITRDPHGNEHPFTGVYREITPPERVVQTFIYDVVPFSQYESVETLILTEDDGVTTVTVTVQYQSPEVREGVIASGMAKGAAETYDRLEEYLTTM